MAQVERKWIEDNAVNNDKLDNTDSYVIKGLLNNADTSTVGKSWVGSDASIMGDASVLTDLFVGGDASFAGDVSVTGPVVFSGDASVLGNLYTAGDTTTAGSSFISGDSAVVGSSSVGGDSTVSGSVSVGGDSTVGGDSHVLGDSSVSGDSWVSGTANMTGDATVMGNFQVDGTAQIAFIAGDATVLGDLTVLGNSHVLGDSTTDGLLFGASDSSIAGDAHVSGDATVGGNLKVDGTAYIGMGTIIIDSSRLVSSYDLFVNAPRTGIGTPTPSVKLEVMDATGEMIRVTDSVHTGSVGTDSSGVFFGSQSDHPMSLMTNGITRATVDTSGNVGVGTADPIGKFNVYDGLIRIDQTASYANLSMARRGPVADGEPAAYLIGYGNNVFQGGVQFRKVDSNNGEIRFRQRVSGANTDTVSLVNGRVGVGTTNPTYKVQVHENAAAESRMQFSNSSTGASSSEGFGVGLTSDGSGFLWSYENTSMIFATNNSERMRITETGAVGIGTATPTSGSMLTVYRSGTGTSYILNLQNNAANTIHSLGKSGEDGIYSIYDAAAERIRMYSSGDSYFTYSVGIGITNPSDKLVVVGDANLWAGTFVGASTTGQSYGLQVTAGTNSSDRCVRFNNRSAALLMEVSGTGNVGIGITPSVWNSSWKAMQVADFGTMAQVGNDSYLVRNLYYGASGWTYQTTGNYVVQRFSSTGEMEYYSNSGSVGAPAGSLTRRVRLILDSTSPALILYGDQSPHIQFMSSGGANRGYVQWQGAPTNRMYYDSSTGHMFGQNVGIKADPGSWSLYVSGTTYVSSTLQVDGVLDLNNYVDMDFNNNTWCLNMYNSSASGYGIYCRTGNTTYPLLRLQSSYAVEFEVAGNGDTSIHGDMWVGSVNCGAITTTGRFYQNANMSGNYSAEFINTGTYAYGIFCNNSNNEDSRYMLYLRTSSYNPVFSMTNAGSVDHRVRSSSWAIDTHNYNSDGYGLAVGLGHTRNDRYLMKLYSTTDTEFEVRGDGMTSIHGDLWVGNINASGNIAASGASTGAGYTYNAPAESVWGSSAGSINIRTATGDIYIQPGGNNTNRGMIFWDNGKTFIPGAYFYTTTGWSYVKIDSSGQLYRHSSSIKYKTDVRDLPEEKWGRVNQMRPVVFKSKCDGDDPDVDHVGFIAEEVEAAGLNEIVEYGPNGSVESVDYGAISSLLVGYVQDLSARLQKAEDEIAALKA